jgi:hypothetical protein
MRVHLRTVQAAFRQRNGVVRSGTPYRNCPHVLQEFDALVLVAWLL